MQTRRGTSSSSARQHLPAPRPPTEKNLFQKIHLPLAGRNLREFFTDEESAGGKLQMESIYFFVFSSFWRMRMPDSLCSLRAMRLSLWRLAPDISCAI